MAKNDFQKDEEALEQEMRKLVLNSSEIDQTAIQADIRELLTGFGIPWVDSPAEAEAQCCFLASRGFADAVVSDDSDSLVFGSPVVLRHLYFGELTVQAFYQSSLGFTPTQFKMLAMLLGCDYTPGVHGIGIVNGAEIVRVYDGFEGLRELYEWASLLGDSEIDADETPQLTVFKEQHKKYRLTWQFPPGFPSAAVWEALTSPVVDRSEEPFSWGVPSEGEIAGTMTRLTGMTDAKARELLRPTLRRYAETEVQRKITEFFGPAFDCGPVGEFVSSRLQKAVR